MENTTIEKLATLKFKNEYISRESLTEDLVSVLDTIKAGQVYASVVHVSASGISRRIKFYRIVHHEPKENGSYIENITPYIAWLRGVVPIGQFVKNDKHFGDYGLTVGGCGMDLIFHTLYSCMVYDEAKVWNQNYRLL